MIVIIRVFGRYKDITGKEKIELDIADGNTIRDIVDVFVKQYPYTEKDKNRMMVTKNKIYSSFNTMVSEGDEITIYPPVVSGG